MAAAPWYLLAGGILLVITGYFMASLGRRSSVFVHDRMSDEEIERAMNEGSGSAAGNVVMLVGFLIVLVSIGWRLVRWLV